MNNYQVMVYIKLIYLFKNNNVYLIINVSLDTGNIRGGPYKFGALGDSFYEYMLKLWLQTGKSEKYLREMYDKAMDGVHNELLLRSPNKWLYLVEKEAGIINKKMDELVCFMPGLLALGAYSDPHNKNSIRDLKTAKALMFTCFNYFNSTETGLAPEIGKFDELRDFYVTERDVFYLLRPETIESLYILNYFTHDPIYKEWGYKIFTSIRKYCKAPYGYAKYDNVFKRNGQKSDVMESFFTAETLKYLYLLFKPNSKDIVDLSKKVYNTEAHPLSIFE